MKCPYCAADYQLGEARCSYCRSALPQPAQAAQQPQQPIQIFNYNFAPAGTAAQQPFAPPMAANMAGPQPAFVHSGAIPPQPVIYRQSGNQRVVSSRSRWIAFLLCLFFGYIGVHHFYAGKIWKGILYILTFGVFTFGWAIDVLKLLFGTYRDGDGLRLK